MKKTKQTKKIIFSKKTVNKAKNIILSTLITGTVTKQ